MAEKFRPRHIQDVVGQDTVKNLIRRSLRNRTFPQFSIMYGPSGSGKSTMAEICGLSLTCENPYNGEPCCQCKSCMDNLALLDKGQASANLCKINMGAIERTDFKKTIKEVFTLQPIVGGSAVYIFEEIQALSKEDQNILLEYISNIQKNIYVIACTTEFNRLRSELRNRAIKFAFKQLKTDEAISLLERICTAKNIKTPSRDISRFLVRATGNCPREIVNLIDFLSDADSFTEQALTEFLGYVGNSTYIEFMSKCNGDTYAFVQWLDTVQEMGYQNVVKGIRNFLVDCYGYIYGSNTTYFNTHEKSALKDIFRNISEEKMLSLMEYFDKCEYDDDTSAKYCLIAGRRRILGQTQQSVMRESKHEASRAVIKSETETKHQVRVAQKPEKITEGTVDDLLSQLGRVKKVPTPVTQINVSNVIKQEEIAEEVDLTEVVDIAEEESNDFQSIEEMSLEVLAEDMDLDMDFSDLQMEEVDTGNK